MNTVYPIRAAITMKLNIVCYLFVLVLLVVLADIRPAFAQEMSKEQWQSDMGTYTAKRADLTNQLSKLNTDVTSSQSQLDKLTADVTACEDALSALVGSSRAELEAFDRELSDMEKRVAELQRMSDAQLMNSRDELEKMESRAKEMTESKLGMLLRFKDRVTALQDRIAALKKSIQPREKTYTVGTWSHDRDCLWNIAKKKDIYDNAWLWPKIWQGNRDKIRDPDVIKPKWVLKIPEGKELTKEEKVAANQYYRKKASAPSSQ